MGKKEKEKPVVEDPPLLKDGISIIGKVPPKDYWEWRTTVTEVEVEKLKQVVAEQKLIVMQKEIEISHLKQKLFTLTVFNEAKESFSRVKTEADKWREGLEGRLGFKIQGCIIDDITYEVKKLEDQPTASISN